MQAIPHKLCNTQYFLFVAGMKNLVSKAGGILQNTHLRVDHSSLQELISCN